MVETIGIGLQFVCACGRDDGPEVARDRRLFRCWFSGRGIEMELGFRG